MFRSKKKLREQLQFEKEQSATLRRQLFTEKSNRLKLETTAEHMKTAHQELRNKYENLQMKMLNRSTPDFIKKKPKRG